MIAYTIEFAGEQPRQKQQIEAENIALECADSDFAYFILFDGEGNQVAAIPYKNVHSILHFVEKVAPE